MSMQLPAARMAPRSVMTDRLAERRNESYLALAGALLWAWLLSYPYYGPVALNLLGRLATGQAFSLGHGAGFLLLGYATAPRPSLLAWPRLPCLMAATCGLLGLATVLGREAPQLVITLFFFVGAFSASLVLRWVEGLAQLSRPALPLVKAMICGNVVCWVTGLPLSQPVSAYVSLGVSTAALLCSPLRFLPLRPPVDTSSLLTWRELIPYLLFGLGVFPCCGLMFRALLPALPGTTLTWISYWPYIIALPLVGCYAVRRGHVALTGATLSVLGLGLLGVAFAPTSAWLLVAYGMLLIGLAGADVFYWLGLVNLYRRGLRSAPALGLALNVLIVAGTGMAADLLHLADPSHMSSAAAVAAALLFLLVPLLLPRLTPEPAGQASREAAAPSVAATDPTELLPEVAIAEGTTAGATAGKAMAEPKQTLTTAARLNLSPAEERVTALLLQGYKYGDIALQLVVSPNTVKYHVRNIFRKTGCSSRGELAALFLRGAKGGTTSADQTSEMAAGLRLDDLRR